MKTMIYRWGILSGLMAILVAACAPAAPAAPAAPVEVTRIVEVEVEVEVEGETVTKEVLVTEVPAPDVTIGDVFFVASGFGPPYVGSFFDHRVTYQLYDGLVGFDGTAISGGAVPKLVPSLAESWVVSDDNTTYTFKIRPNVKFANGKPVNANAVKKSIDRAISVIALKGETSRYSWAEGLQATEVVDEMTFRMILGAPNVPALAALASTNFMIVEVDEVLAHQVEGDFGAGWLNQNSAGSGPFVIDKFTPEQRLVLRRNPTYWGGVDGVQPSVERLIWVHVPEPAAREMMIGGGELDMALSLDAVALATLTKNAKVRIEAFPALMTCNFILDLRIEELKKGHPKVLQAVKYAINYEGFRDIVAGGLADIRQSNFLPGMNGYKPEQDTSYTFDPAKAKQLLAEAGYPDGFATKLYNRPGSCGTVTYKAATEYWQQNLAEVGIRAEIIETTGAVMWGEITTQKWRTFGITAAGATFFDADNPASVRAKSEAPLMGWEEVDPVAAKRAAELTLQGQQTSDPAARDAIYAEIAQLMIETSPYMTFLQVKDAVVVGSNIGGVVAVPGAFPLSFKYVTKK